MPRYAKANIPAIIGDLILGSNHETRRRSLFDFIGHIYHPYLPKLSSLDASILEVNYLTSLHSKSISEDDEAGQKVEISLDKLRLLSQLVHSEELYDLNLTAEFFPFEQEFVADIVRFILAFESKSRSRRKAASIKKAHYFHKELGGFHHPKSMHGNYGSKWSKNWGGFSRRWTLYKPVFMFCYVDFYEFESKLSRAHAHPEFASFIDELLADRDGLRKFFEKSLYVYQRVRSILDRRVFESLVGLPKFPKWLRPRRVYVQPLTREQQTKMEEYSFGTS
jgi:hypothetical protein